MKVTGETKRPSQHTRLKILAAAATMAAGGCSGQSSNFVTGPNACGPWEAHTNLLASSVMEQGVQVPESDRGVMVRFGKLATAMAVAHVDKDGNVRIAPLLWHDTEADDYALAVSLEPGTWVAGIVIGFNEAPDQVMTTTVSNLDERALPPLTCQELRQNA